MANVNVNATTQAWVLDNHPGSRFSEGRFSLRSVYDDPENDTRTIVQVGDHVLAVTETLELTTHLAIIDAVGPPVNVDGITATLQIDNLWGTRYGQVAKYNITPYRYNTAGFPADIFIDNVRLAITQQWQLATNTADIAHDRVVTGTTQAWQLQTHDAAIAHDRVITATTEAFQLATIIAEHIGLNQLIAGTTQAWQLQTFDAAISDNVMIDGITATFSLTGQDATISLASSGRRRFIIIS